jgi:hypothetical protein
MKSEDVENLISMASIQKGIDVAFENDRMLSFEPSPKPYTFDNVPIVDGFYLDMSRCIYK